MMNEPRKQRLVNMSLFCLTQTHTHTHANIYVCARVYFPNHSAQAKCDTRPIFEQSLNGLNAEFVLLLDWLLYTSTWKHTADYAPAVRNGIWYKSKVAKYSRGRPEGSLFSSYYTEV